MAARDLSPTTAFSRALQSLYLGSVGHEFLLSEIDRQLTVERADPTALLEALEIQQSAEPLPAPLYQSILNRLLDWPQDPTVPTGSHEEHGGSPPVQVGDVLQGRFRLVALIGKGGMSRVFKAVDLRRVEAGASDPHVAIKVLTEPFSAYFGSLTALQREAHNLQSLRHPNIVRVIDCDRHGQIVFMTMEYLEGGSLQKKLRTAGPEGLDSGTARAIVGGIACALEYAHRNHIVHGDLKPGNVIVTESGVKVIDFGMARFMARPGDAEQDEAFEHGKPAPAVTRRYASPEMLAGQEPEAADDVYALGCLAYEVLCGTHPFAGRQYGAEAPPDLHARPNRRAGMAAYEYRALVGALKYDRYLRTQSVREFLDEFTGVHRRAAIKRWALAGVAAALLVAGAWYRVTSQHAASPAASASASANMPGAVIRDCPTCPLLTVLPVGRFTQGAAQAAPDGVADPQAAERPAHLVTIGYPLAMGTNEVTVGEFREFVEAAHPDLSGCHVYDGGWQYRSAANWQNPGFAQSAAHPVTCASWNDAAAYVVWLSKKSGHAYRLPSASEWEYAAQAGTAAARPWSANAADACAYGNVADQSAAQRFPGWDAFACSDGYVNTAPVGSFIANAFGLNDLFGNVFEWVEDCWHETYEGAFTDGSARLDGDCKEREMRGGSWFSAPQFVGSSYRNRFESDYRSSSIGFRVVRELGK